MQRRAGDPHVLWRFSDGTPGHDAQTLGLARALQARCHVEIHELAVGDRLAAFGAWLAGRYAPGRSLPGPDLLIGAGHATHWHLLAARRAVGGRAVVLMQPSLPNRLFDLCLVPEHDNPRSAANVLVTHGVLNTLEHTRHRAVDRGLILLGGPSPHYRWSDAGVLAQVDALLAARPALRWQVLVSRRTPASISEALRNRRGLEWLAPETSLADVLSLATQVYVSEDSVSMVYEALTSGAPTGLLAVPRRSAGRVGAGIDALVARGWVAAPGAREKPPSPPVLDEAGRCADWIVEQWLNVN